MAHAFARRALKGSHPSTALDSPACWEHVPCILSPHTFAQHQPLPWAALLCCPGSARALASRSCRRTTAAGGVRSLACHTAALAAQTWQQLGWQKQCHHRITRHKHMDDTCTAERKQAALDSRGKASWVHPIIK